MIPKPDIKIGEKSTVQKQVEEQDTAANVGTGELDTLLSTPSLISMMMEASVNLIDKKLEDGFISVGKMAGVTHEKTTVLGETVSVEVKVLKFDGNLIELGMTAFDEIGVIAHGHHQSIVVNKKRLLENATIRATSLSNKDF